MHCKPVSPYVSFSVVVNCKMRLEIWATTIEYEVYLCSHTAKYRAVTFWIFWRKNSVCAELCQWNHWQINYHPCTYLHLCKGIVKWPRMNTYAEKCCSNWSRFTAHGVYYIIHSAFINCRITFELFNQTQKLSLTCPLIRGINDSRAWVFTYPCTVRIYVTL